MPEKKKRFTTVGFNQEWTAEKERLVEAKQLMLEMLVIITKAEERHDSLYEGVTGFEAPDLNEMAS